MNKPYYITAYGLAVKRGFKGSMDEWLESLHGYVHIKYSEDMPAADSDMQDEPADWMGIYTGDKAEASTSYKDYKWHYVKGVANAAVIAPAFSAAKQYKSGEIVSYGDRILACRAAECMGSFNPADWKETTLAEALEERGISTAVSYEAQSLDAGQKTQARRNIGAMAEDKTVTGAMLENGAVTKDKIGNGEVDGNKLADGSVAGRHLTDDAKGLFMARGEELPANSVDFIQIKDGAVHGAKLNLANGDLGKIKLKSGTHYFAAIDDVPADMKAAGMLVFVKAAD